LEGKHAHFADAQSGINSHFIHIEVGSRLDEGEKAHYHSYNKDKVANIEVSDVCDHYDYARYEYKDVAYL